MRAMTNIPRSHGRQPPSPGRRAQPPKRTRPSPQPENQTELIWDI